MHDSTPRQTSILSVAAKAGGLYGSEAAAERTLRRQALRALDKVEQFVNTGFLSIREIEDKLEIKLEAAISDKGTEQADDQTGN
ncbi:hypothetical protein CWC06_20200 [Pseudoalteromonas ruthenica]|uniref:Uncharacterized protein n=2 Tax=Pseudoalteromonas TaxID=53246 RepID=A0A5S3V2X3_9GAMM|nr:hypothetical protein [Pseudoalteromonas aurantia]TMO64871.1 hypothetical protein CWC19_18125 [Pseudoalteromonas aurantia]TMP17101.1 hypothetical protein CWC06_20200 [Pseudoalteromonas ruthenica]